MIRFAFFALIFPLSSYASMQQEECDCLIGKQYQRAVLRHIESGGIGYKDGYTTLEVFLTPDSSHWSVTPFLDCKGHIFDNGNWAANAGIGLRTLWKNQVYGINTYYDYRNAGRFNSNQIGIGFETLGERFEFHVNGYLPIGKKNSKPYGTVFGAFSGNHMLLSQKYQSAMKGFNAELGVHFAKYKFFDFYAAAGPYYFIGEIARSTWGGKARISGTFRNVLTLEISNSYDRTFHNKFQAQVSVGFSFGHTSREKEQCGRICSASSALYDRMYQSVERQEIIVVDNARKKSVAIDPSTGKPYFFVFVDNTSHSNGTYESPYHSLTQAQDHSSPNNIIYVFPGDGTTTGMDSGIILKPNQKFWGSGVSHLVQTTQGTITIPAQSGSSPTMTNRNVDTEGNGITLASNNSISGFTIDSAINDAIYGVDAQNLEVSSCTFKNTSTYAIEASSLGDAAVSIKDNQFLDNVNGIFLTFNGTSSLICSHNTFSDQTSVSSFPLEILANNNILSAQIKNNIFKNNATGSIRLNLNNAVDVGVNILNNTMTNNGTGAQASLGSNVVVLSNGTTENCLVLLKNNLFSGNTSNSLYMHTSGAIENLKIVAAANTMSGNGGSAFVLATPTEHLTLQVIDNTITDCNDNAIAVISSGKTSTGNITINNNIITDIANASNGIAVNQDFSELNLTIANNEINRCEGTGIISYAPTGIDSLTLNISDNKINNCQNLSSNAASGIDIEQYTNFKGSIANNELLDNTGVGVVVGSSLPSPAACLTLTGNNSGSDYLLSNPVDGVFNLAPCDADSVNIGTINTGGVITPVQSCPDALPCSP